MKNFEKKKKKYNSSQIYLEKWKITIAWNKNEGYYLGWISILSKNFKYNK